MKLLYDESKLNAKEVIDPKGELFQKHIQNEIESILSANGFKFREIEEASERYVERRFKSLLFWNESECLGKHIIYAIGFEDSCIHIGYVCKDWILRIGYIGFVEWKDKSNDELLRFILENVEFIQCSAINEENTDYYDEAMKTQMLFDDISKTIDILDVSMKR